MNTITGKILRVNLTDRSIKAMEINEEWKDLYIGGEGLAAKILYDELEPGIDPLGEKNLLIFATGPLTGTKAPCSGRLCVGFKSPLTGTIGLSNSGGHFTPMIKRSGWDAIIIEGKSSSPVYIYIKDEEVNFKDAAHLWGKDVTYTEDKIREELDNPKVRIADIGPAGENLVLMSSIMIDKSRAAGRGSPGAVMGSKNLKAIAVYSENKIEVADARKMDEFAKQARKELNDEAFVREELKPFGTASFTDSINALGLLPTKNWQYTTFDKMDKLGHVAYHETLKVKPWACFGCPIGCGREVEILGGEFKGEKGAGPEYETIGAFGAKCYIDDLNAITKGNFMCDALGLDTISVGQTIASAMEWFEKGLIDKETTGGIDLSFGNTDALLKMIEMIAKREGYGNVLADGSLKAAKTIGDEAEKYIFQVKGMELASCGVRASKGESLSHLISPRGADHLRPYASVIDAFGYIEPELGIHEKVSPFEDENKWWVKPFMELSMMTNLLGVCLFASITLAVKGHTWTELYNAATGRIKTFEEMMEAAERVINLERLFNEREGFDRKDEKLPIRLSTEPAPDGLGKGQVANEEIMKDEFYKSMGWDIKTGLATKETLKRLKLS
ncbi:MAG TPA: aldehyde ferredoxin oxidoreductase family protein [Atribacterota bacterium]|nr:aldehyde ferredoxin oxidoreductase family protein [Atribacterota bacterium]